MVITPLKTVTEALDASCGGTSSQKIGETHTYKLLHLPDTHNLRASQG